MQTYFNENSVRGTIIISSEGINGTISAKKENLRIGIAGSLNIEDI